MTSIGGTIPGKSRVMKTNREQTLGCPLPVGEGEGISRARPGDEVGTTCVSRWLNDSSYA